MHVFYKNIFSKIFNLKKLNKFCNQNFNIFCKQIHNFNSRTVEKSKYSLNLLKMTNKIDILNEFEIVTSCSANSRYPVTKYVSKSTGLQLVHAQIEGPIVDGYIVLATRAAEDDGLPHTLEHLIFLGSEDYPYNGVLDLLANKCLASGTNAWTDVDHTCYTLTTAGSEGFCTLLPIYMDHILYPTLADTGFVTEVYHVNEEGEDSGVVYSEMQAKENSGETLANTELVRTIYPSESGYHYITGGIMKNLRESCSNEKVKDFHKKFYNSKNTCVIVCGQMEPTCLFRALEPIIVKINEKNDVVKNWEQPWLDEIPEIIAPIEKTFKFPSDEDDEVLLTIGFHGPSCVNEFEEVQALRILLEYLTDSTVAPLQSEFVENDSPLASSVVYNEMENSKTTFYFEFESVPKERMNEIVPRLKESLKKQVEEFDGNRMNDIIKKNYLEELSSMENTPNSSICYAVIGDFLYGGGCPKKYAVRLNAAKTFQDFLAKDASYWTDMIGKRILNQNLVQIYAISSIEEKERISKEDETRIEKRKKAFGSEGLKKLGHDLKTAIESNRRPAPIDMLESIIPPSTKSINFHKISRLIEPEFTKDFPCQIYTDNITSNFVYISILMDTTDLVYEHRKHLSLFTEALTESPVKLDDGTLLDYETVVAALNRDFLSYATGVGIAGSKRFKCSSFSHLINFSLQIEMEKVGEAFAWIRKILWNTEWDCERLKVLATKMKNDVTQIKRKGNRISETLLKDILYKTESNQKATSCIRQQKFLELLIDSLPMGSSKLVNTLEDIRKMCTTPKNMTLHIATDFDKLQKTLEKQEKSLQLLLKNTFSFDKEAECIKRIANDSDKKWMNDVNWLTGSPKQVIMGLGSEDSSFLVQSVPSLANFNDPDIAALMTAIQYFCQTEGPFYKAIRGQGFAYGFWMSSRPNEGMLYFNLYRCTDVFAAYKCSQDIIIEHINGVDIWSEEMLISAKSSLIFEIIEGEKTPLALAVSSMLNYYKNTPCDQSKILIDKISKIEMAEVQAVTEKYLGDIFNKPCNLALVCPTDKASALKSRFGSIGKNLDVLPSINKCFLSSW